MNEYKVCVYTICKNESEFVDRWVDSMQEADKIVVCDTGSTDDTVKKLEARGVDVYKVVVNPWRFDVARNISLSFVPSDIDICVCTDMDEILEEGWREKLEEVWQLETTRLRYMYTWNFNDDGTRGVTYWYDKIHNRQGYRWVNPVHETPKYFGDKREVFAKNSSIQLNHFPNKTKSRGQYLNLLELSKEENPKDNNTVFWLGREYMFYSKFDKCIKTLNEFLSLESATWDEQRCAAMRYIARSYQNKGDLDEAKKWLYRAIAECSTIREPYVELAKLAYTLKDWMMVYSMVEQTLKITEKTVSYIREDFCWDSTIYDIGSIACYWINMYNKAFEFVNIAIEMSPNDERLKNNLVLINEKIKEGQINEKAKNMCVFRL